MAGQMLSPSRESLDALGSRELVTAAALHALSRPTLGFPADFMRDASVVGGIYGAQLADIDDPRAHAVRRLTTGT